MSDFQLDANELTKEIPFPLKGMAKKFIDYINNLDANHDGKKDLAQLAPIVISILPLIQRLAANIDWNEVKVFIKASRWSKEEAELETIFKELQAALALIPKA